MAHNGINGQAKSLPKKEILRRTLGDDGNPVSGNYRPSFPLGYYGPDIVPLFMILWDVERMLQHPQIAIAMCHYKSAIANAEFDVKGSSQAAADYYLAMIQRFWERSLHHAQGSYHFGWQGLEVMYDVEDNRLVFDSTLDFSPRDVNPITLDGKLWAVRVQNIEGINGPVDLWSPRASKYADDQLPDIPAKGFWHAHNPTHHRWYGRTQLYSAWRPWRRLTGLDGAENIIDGGMYRSAYQGPLVRYPEEGGYDENDTQFSFRDRARELAEKAKGGVSVAMPSTRDESGYLKWELEWGKFNAQGLETLIAYVDYLRAEIHQGIGVPAELIEASETGSGYSGRAIPMEGFLMGQMLNAQAILKSFCEQVADPLLRWNFGPKAWAKAKVKNLLETKNKAAMGGEGQMPPPQPAAPEQAPQDQALPEQAPDPLAELFGGNLSTLRHGEDDDVVIEEETFLSLFRLAGMDQIQGPFTGERGGTYWVDPANPDEKIYQHDKPGSQSTEQKTDPEKPTEKAKGILSRVASLPGKLIPQRVKDAVGKVKVSWIRSPLRDSTHALGTLSRHHAGFVFFGLRENRVQQDLSGDVWHVLIPDLSSGNLSLKDFIDNVLRGILAATHVMRHADCFGDSDGILVAHVLHHLFDFLLGLRQSRITWRQVNDVFHAVLYRFHLLLDGLQFFHHIRMHDALWLLLAQCLLHNLR